MAFIDAGYACEKAHEMKLLLETAKLNNITINDELFNKMFDKIYGYSGNISIEESTTKTRTETK